MDQSLAKEQGTSPDAREKGPGLSLERCEEVAKALIREGLDPAGLNVPERDFREWVIALGRLYARH